MQLWKAGRLPGIPSRHCIHPKSKHTFQHFCKYFSSWIQPTKIIESNTHILPTLSAGVLLFRMSGMSRWVALRRLCVIWEHSGVTLDVSLGRIGLHVSDLGTFQWHFEDHIVPEYSSS
jgi:hypothetical protein